MMLITVFCTNRGQHPRRRLYYGTDDGVTGLRVPASVDRESWHRDGGMRFRCKTCRRDEQLTRARWERLTRRLAEAGQDKVDISYLDDILNRRA